MYIIVLSRLQFGTISTAYHYGMSYPAKTEQGSCLLDLSSVERTTQLYSGSIINVWVAIRSLRIDVLSLAGLAGPAV